MWILIIIFQQALLVPDQDAGFQDGDEMICKFPCILKTFS
jgi:hypothetical protein